MPESHALTGALAKLAAFDEPAVHDLTVGEVGLPTAEVLPPAAGRLVTLTVIRSRVNSSSVGPKSGLLALL